ncbi:hypothetical protein RB195_015897 [Necator americanus]|uniref:Endonuclease/exonuclease/phosphatase domain-containing protein n=1 Tax=Necator americanus TaxID=51031 RepID=A0ABR1E7A8_NECAM
MAICTYSARTLASEAAIEDLMMQSKKIKYDVIRLTETRRRHPLNAVYETGEELCVPTPALTIFVAYAPTSSYDEEEVEAFYMDLEKFYRKDHAFYKVIIGDFNARVGPRKTPEELHIGTHGLQWNDQGERLSEFIMTTKTIHGNSQFQKPSSLRWTWEPPGGGYRNEIDHIIVNKRPSPPLRRIFLHKESREGRQVQREKSQDYHQLGSLRYASRLLGRFRNGQQKRIEEYDQLVEHLHDCAKKAESFKTTKRRLSLETLELIRHCGAARATGNQELTSELARLCREAIKEDLKERRAEVLAEAAEAGKSIRYALETCQKQKQPLHREGGWRKSPTTSTLISSTAMSTYLLTI